MADTLPITSSLFGISPESLQAQRQAMQEAQAMRFAQLDPSAQAQYGFFRAGQQAGTGLSGLLGGGDPELEAVKLVQSLGAQYDKTTPEGLGQLAQALQATGNPYAQQFAVQAADKAQQMKAVATKAAFDEARTARETALAERALADAQRLAREDGLKNLPPEVQTILLMEKRDPEFDSKKAMKDFLDRKAQAQWSDPYQLGGATVQRNSQTGEIRTAVSRPPVTRIDMGGNKPAKPLPASLQKSEDTDLEVIGSLQEQAKTLTPSIEALKTAKLELGPKLNAENLLRNASGNSTPESRAYAELERAVQSATNLKVSAEKGVQTDKDVLRFANELIAAFGKYDTKTSIDALANYKAAIERAQQRRVNILQSRRKSQGIDPYDFGDNNKVEEAPVVPKPTKRWNPQTKQLENM